MPAIVRAKHPWLLPAMTCGLMAGILLGRGASGWWGAEAGLVMSLALCCREKHRTVGAVLAVLFLGAGLGYGAYHPVLPSEGEHLITGVVVQRVRTREDGQVQTVLRDVAIDGEAWRGGAYWTYYLDEGELPPEALIPGARVAVAAEVYHPSGRENPEGFDFREYLLQQDIRFGVYGAEELTIGSGGFSVPGTLAYVRYVLTGRLMDLMGEEAGGYAAAMLLGERDEMPPEGRSAFEKLGIVHILSISGYHVGVLSALISLLMRPIPLRRSHALAVRSGLLAIYCLLTGGRAPVIRAALLSVLTELGRVRNRQTLALHTLSLSALVQLLFTPAVLTSASFQLTYSAMIGLLLLRPGIQRLLSPIRPRTDRLWSALSACLAVQLGVLPAQLYWFGKLPLLSLVGNLLILPLFTGLLALYWAALLLCWLPGVGEALGWLSMQATQWLMRGITPLGDMAHAWLFTRRPDLIALMGWGVMCLGLVRLLHRRHGRWQRMLAALGALLLLTVLLPLPHAETTYIQFSVGEADAALLHDRDCVVVIDAGEDGEALAGYLRSRNLAVDMLIITHLHSDHAGGIQALLADEIPVRRCLLPDGGQKALIDLGMAELLDGLTASGTEICSLSRGDVLPLPSGALTVLWPEEGRSRPMQEANHSSLVLLAELRGTKLLLTGDLSGTYEQYTAVQADVLKAAHHGSMDSTSAEFLTEVNPQVILQSCGTDLRETLFASRAGEIPVYSTHSDGAITIRFEEDGFWVEGYLQE